MPFVITHSCDYISLIN